MILLKKIIGLIFIGGLLFIMTYGTLLKTVINYINASTNKDLWYLIRSNSFFSPAGANAMSLS
jgi:uncharacterized membrane protein YqhA